MNEIENELKHWGILGMKWGVRRYQNEDGSLTPEGRERYSKQLSKSTEQENKTYKLARKAIKEMNKRLPVLNAKYTDKEYIDEEYGKAFLQNWKEIYGDLLKKEYGEIADKLYTDEEEWLNKFDYYTIYDDYFNDELKHWGILGMKWGIRNYQNPDGSLTPLGRIRYGVGPKKEITGNVLGANDAGSLSDEELKRMTRRYQNQADYYQARNNYIFQENRYKENTAPKPKEKKEHTFLKNVLGRPLENFMTKNTEFFFTFMGYKGMEQLVGPELAAQYMSSVSGMKMESKDPIKKATDDARKMSDYYKTQNDLKYNKSKYEGKKDPSERYKETKDEAQYYKNLNNIIRDKDTINKKRDKLLMEMEQHIMDPNFDLEGKVREYYEMFESDDD